MATYLHSAWRIPGPEEPLARYIHGSYWRTKQITQHVGLVWSISGLVIYWDYKENPLAHWCLCIDACVLARVHTHTHDTHIVSILGLSAFLAVNLSSLTKIEPVGTLQWDPQLQYRTIRNFIKCFFISDSSTVSIFGLSSGPSAHILSF